MEQSNKENEKDVTKIKILDIDNCDKYIDDHKETLNKLKPLAKTKLIMNIKRLFKTPKL